MSLCDEAGSFVYVRIHHVQPPRVFEEHIARRRRRHGAGWLARAAGDMKANDNGFLGMQVGPGKLPLAMTGGGSGIISLGDPESFELTLTGTSDRQQARRKLLDDLSNPTAPTKE